MIKKTNDFFRIVWYNIYTTEREVKKMSNYESEITMIFDRHHELTMEEKKFIRDKVEDFMCEIADELKWDCVEMIFNHTGIRKK